MRQAYLDGSSGISGDMFLGALLDAGFDAKRLLDELKKLSLGFFKLKRTRALRGGIVGTRFEVETSGDQPHRKLADIEAMLTPAALSDGVKEKALKIFRRLAEAEGKLHGKPASDVHFHEVGAVDAIIDIVGAVCGLNLLGVEAVHVSPLPLGRGFTRSEHGKLPLPAPAVVELLQGAPVLGALTEAETVTPTGAAILTTLAKSIGPLPPMRLTGVGYGAGRRDAEYPNVLRVLLGDADAPGAEAEAETLVLIETNIDDMNPQLYEHVFTRLFVAGALDVWLAPAHMKKNRPGHVLNVLCRPAQETAVRGVIFHETTTLGLRRQWIERHSLPREMRTVRTRFGEARVKVALAEGRVLRAIPEYEDCKRLAEANGVPLRDVLAEVEQAARGGADDNPTLR